MLEREQWDRYLMQHFFDFLNQEGNHIQVGNGKCLRPGIKYRFTDTPNRNPNQVDDLMWKKLIYTHFVKHNYN